MKTILAMLLAITPFYSFSQVKIYNILLEDSTKKILYLGVINILKVEGKNSKFNECSLTVDKTKVITIENNYYDIRPEVSGAIVVNFYEKGELVLSEKWNVQRIPLDVLKSTDFKQKLKNVDIIRRIEIQ